MSNGVLVNENCSVAIGQIEKAKQVLRDNIIAVVRKPEDVLELDFSGNLLFDTPFREAVKKYVKSETSVEKQLQALTNETFKITGETEECSMEDLELYLSDYWENL